MSQTRIHLTATRPGSLSLYRALEADFEDDGLPLAITELDEAAGVDELSIYVETADTDDAERRVLALMRQVGVEAELRRESLDDIDWVAKSLEGLQPVRAGRFLVHGSHDRAKRQAGDLAIEIEAGLAFGTGHHGTTAGCLDMLTGVVNREAPGNALDLGTGSAVLAIALAKLARIPVLATDIDPIATKVATGNVRLNQVSSCVRTATAAGFQNPVFSRYGPFDLIVANILARPLMMLAPKMAHYVRPGGSIVLSGILDRQRNAVVAAYVGQRFRHVLTTHREGWVTIHMKR